MNILRISIIAVLAVPLLPAAVYGHCGGNHTGDHPHCSDGGGGEGSDIATNDITARWEGTAITGAMPRFCTLGSDPHPKGTHTAYTCEQDMDHTILVDLRGGVLTGGKRSPTPEEQALCTDGFMFQAYPTSQYVVAVGGEICTEPDGCPLRVQNVIYGQPGTPTVEIDFDLVKFVGEGRVPQSTNLNPFACPEPELPIETRSYPINTIEVSMRNGGNKAQLVCLFDVTGTTSFEVTPVCP